MPGRTEFTPDEIAARLERWRPAVLREMGRRRLWNGAPAAECEDQFQDVAFVLVTRRFNSDEHLLRALWTGLGFRARDFWKSARRRETCVGDFYDEVIGEDRAAAPDDAAATAADRRHVDDCLSELDPREQAVYRLVKGEGLSRRKAAKALRVSEADVLRALYSAQRKVDQFTVLLVSGRLCSRRSSAVRALARAQARGAELQQARAHLSHCRSCLLGFREYQALLGRDVAALAPGPAVALAAHAANTGGGVVDSVRHGFATLRTHATAVAGRSPSTSGATEALVGGGGLGGAAAGAKLAIGLCVAAAGGGAICAQTLGLFPATSPHRTPAAAAHPHRHHARAADAPTAPKSAGSSADTMNPAPTPPQQQTATTPNSPPPQPPPPQQQPAPEFFGGSSSSPSVGASSPSTSGSTTSSGSGSAQSSPRSSSGGGGEFFGG